MQKGIAIAKVLTASLAGVATIIMPVPVVHAMETGITVMAVMGVPAARLTNRR